MEILVVILILGVLATVTVFAVRGVTSRGEQSACAGDARTLTTAADAWKAQAARAEVPALGSSPDRYELCLVDSGMIRQVSTRWNLNADDTVTTTTGNPCKATAAAPSVNEPTVNGPSVNAPSVNEPTVNESTANEPKSETVVPGFPATDDLQVFLLQAERDPDLLGKSGANSPINFAAWSSSQRASNARRLWSCGSISSSGSTQIRSLPPSPSRSTNSLRR